jgi:16S rRNA G1207 methylase RsmC
LDKIAKINQLLGGNKLTLEGLKELLESVDKHNEITIVDIGCGNGDMLRYIAEYAKDQDYNFKLIGIDANAFTINHQNLSVNYQNISYHARYFTKEEIKHIVCAPNFTSF